MKLLVFHLCNFFEFDDMLTALPCSRVPWLVRLTQGPIFANTQLPPLMPVQDALETPGRVKGYLGSNGKDLESRGLGSEVGSGLYGYMTDTGALDYCI